MSLRTPLILVLLAKVSTAAPLVAEGEAPSWGPRAELVATQTLNGAAQGLFLAGIIDSDTGVGTVLGLGGALVGGTTAFLLTRDGKRGLALAGRF